MARAMRSAFSACCRKNLDSFTIAVALMQVHLGYINGRPKALLKQYLMVSAMNFARSSANAAVGLLAAASRKPILPWLVDAAISRPGEIADDPAASGPYRIASQEQEVSREKLDELFT